MSPSNSSFRRNVLIVVLLGGIPSALLLLLKWWPGQIPIWLGWVLIPIVTLGVPLLTGLTGIIVALRSRLLIAVVTVASVDVLLAVTVFYLTYSFPGVTAFFDARFLLAIFDAEGPLIVIGAVAGLIGGVLGRLLQWLGRAGQSGTRPIAS